MGQARREPRAPVPEDQVLPGRAGLGQGGTIPVLQQPREGPSPTPTSQGRRPDPKREPGTGQALLLQLPHPRGEWEWPGLLAPGEQDKTGARGGSGSHCDSAEGQSGSQTGHGRLARQTSLGGEGQGSDRGQRGSRYKGTAGREHQGRVWGDQ